MIDIHAHIMPGIDDGAESLTEALMMLRTAAENGVHTIVATPHCNMQDFCENYYDDYYMALFDRLVAEAAAENIPVKILQGMEVYASENIPKLLKQGSIIPLGDSRYILIEFGMEKDLALIDFISDELPAMGYVPIIAHPERYPYLQRAPHMAAKWLKAGCLLQVNKGSILGTFGRHTQKTALYLLEHNMISFIASDAHGALRRTTDLSGVFDFLCSNFSLEIAYMLLEDNPARLIDDRDFSKLKLMPDQQMQ